MFLSLGTKYWVQNILEGERGGPGVEICFFTGRAESEAEPTGTLFTMHLSPLQVGIFSSVLRLKLLYSLPHLGIPDPIQSNPSTKSVSDSIIHSFISPFWA